MAHASPEAGEADGGQMLDVVRRSLSRTMGMEHVRNTVTLRNFLRGDARDRSVRPRTVLCEFITAMCLVLLIAIAVIGGWLALFHWVAVSLPPPLLLSCPEVEGCASHGLGEHSEVPIDSLDVLHVVP